MLHFKHGKIGLLVLSCLLLLQLAKAQGPPTVQKAEYFIDYDPGIGNGIGFTIPVTSDSINETQSVVLPNNISGGMHFLYIRTMASDGAWSLTAKRMFYVNTNSTDNQAEYFFDTDPGIGNGTPISISSNSDSVSVNSSVSVPSGLSSGMHVLYIRSRSSSGHWSLTASRVINVTAPEAISKAEYFFDTDPGIGNGLPISIGSGNDSVNMNANVNIPSTLSGGEHFMYLRTMTGDGKWSLAASKRIYVSNKQVIDAAEYFLDNDPGAGNGTAISIPVASDSVNVNINLSTTGMPAGEHVIYVRTRSLEGVWSLAYIWQRIFIQPKITDLRYWFDTIPDMAVGQTIHFSNAVQSDSVNINTGISVPSLSVGWHYLFTSTMDELGRWSIPVRDSIYIICAAQVDTIAGPSNACAYMGTVGGNATYRLSNRDMATFSWTVSDPLTMQIVGTSTDTIVQVHYTSAFTGGTLSVAATGFCIDTTITRFMFISKSAPLTPASILGPNNACTYIGTGAVVTYSVVPDPNVVRYRWTLPANTSFISASADSSSISISFNSNFASGTAAQRTIKVKAISGCGNSTDKSLAIAVTAPATPGPVSGPSNVCSYVGGAGGNAVFSIRKVANTSSYSWTVPASATIISYSGAGNAANDTSIVVSFSNAFVAGSIDTIKVRAQSTCGISGFRTFVVKSTLPATPSPIAGVTDACPLMGTGTPATYTIRKVANANSYQWTLPAGVDTVPGHPTNDTILYVTFSNSFNNSFIGVRSVSGCGVSTNRTLTIYKKLPITPAAISGPTNACPLMNSSSNATYTTRKVKYATSYTWTVPAGATIVDHPGGNADNDTIIVVSYGSSFISGSVTVVANANCGSSGTRSLNIVRLVPNTPSPVSGPTDVCSIMGTASVATYTTGAVANADYYTWTVPSGANIVSGQGTTSITVSYDNSFVSGNIAVTASNNCLTSAPRTLAITRKTPATAGPITAGTPTACPGRQVSYSIAALPANASSVNWIVPAGASIISGQGTTTVLVSYPSSAISDTIRVVGVNNCSTGPERKLKVTLSACPPLIARSKPVQAEVAEEVNDLSVTVMPNPSQYEFRILVRAADINKTISMQVTDINGRVMQTKQGINSGQWIILGADYKPGIYMAVFEQGNTRKSLKLIKM